MANGDGNGNGVKRTLAAGGGITVATLAAWLTLLGTYKAKVDQCHAKLQVLSPIVAEAAIDRERIRTDLAELRPMVAELLRRQERMDSKIDRLMDR